MSPIVDVARGCAPSLRSEVSRSIVASVPSGHPAAFGPGPPVQQQSNRLTCRVTVSLRELWWAVTSMDSAGGMRKTGADRLQR